MNIQRTTTSDALATLSVQQGTNLLLIEDGVSGKGLSNSTIVRVERGAHLVYNLNMVYQADAERSIIFELEDDARLDVYGIVAGKGASKLALTIEQRHIGKGSTGMIAIHELAQDDSIFALNGTIMIPKNAVQSRAHLEGRALLLGAGAQADIIPNLEIHAQDVKAGHAAAAGPIDREQMFYLTSRGVPEKEAQQMIVQGFVEHLINKLPDEHQQTIVKSLWHAHLV